MTWRSDSVEVVRGQGRTDGPSYLWTGGGVKVINRGIEEKWLVGIPNTLVWVHGVY
jgi:hypothetical protein